MRKAILAGIAIGLGGTVYLATGQPWLFPIGLYIVCFYGLSLFTGKVCYGTLKTIPGLAGICICNICAAYITGLAVGYCKPALAEKATALVQAKLTESIPALAILAVLCNVCIFVAVDTYKRSSPLGLLFATTVFVASGYEHCVANAFYLGVAKVLSTDALSFLALNVLFNAAGGKLARILLTEDRR